MSDSNAVCPRDGGNLDDGHFHDTPVRHCKTCDGVLVKQNQLVALLLAMSTDIADHIDEDSEVTPMPDPGDRLDCPECKTKMDSYGYMGSSAVTIDCCQQCLWLWIDPGELGTMCVIYQRANKRLAVKQTAAKQMTRNLEKLDLGMAVQNALWTRFQLIDLL